MTLEELKNKGLTEDQAKFVLEMHKKAIDGNYVPKATFDAEREKVKTANATIVERDKQINDLGKFKGSAEDLQKKVDELSSANATAKQEYEAKLAKMEQDTILKIHLSDIVYNTYDVLPKLDLTKISFADGKVASGLDEQIKALKESNPYYFKPEGGMPNGWNPFGKTPEPGAGPDSKNAQMEFGKQLAQQVSGADTFAKKAEDIYFK